MFLHQNAEGNTNICSHHPYLSHTHKSDGAAVTDGVCGVFWPLPSPLT